MSLSDIVTVTIQTNARGVTRAGFGTPLICGYTTAWADRVREYNDLTELAADGVGTNSPIYKAAASVLAQDPNVTTFKVGRRALAPSQTVDITPATAGAGFAHKVDVTSASGNITSVSYTQVAGDAVADIIDGMVSQLNAVSGLTTTDNTTYITCAADDAGTLYYYDAKSSSLGFQDNTADPGIATDLTAIRNEDDDWYGFVLDSNSEAEIKAAQAVIETLPKQAVYNTSDTGVKDANVTDDVASDLQDLTYDRCVLLYSGDHSGYGGAAWDGTILPTDAGSGTWAYKSLAGVTVDNLSTSEQSAIAAKNCNYYTTIKGLNLTFDGTTPGGSFGDIIRGRDQLVARIEENIVSLVANNPKVPYTDTGVDMVITQVDQAIKAGQSDGYIAFDPEPTITAPLVANVSTANKTARHLPDVNFTCTIQGAIHSVAIAGTVSV
jgi:hypothetical protein